MQTDSEINRILNALTVGQTVTVKYIVRGTYYSSSMPFERNVDVTVQRIDNLIYGSAFSAQFGRSEVFIRTKNGQNVVRIGGGDWYVITSAESPFVK